MIDLHIKPDHGQTATIYTAKKMMTLTRMRTIPKAYAEIKAIDPNTDFTLRALRRMVKNGEIPTVQIASKKLINLDLLLDLLSCYNDSATCASLGKEHRD